MFQYWVYVNNTHTQGPTNGKGTDICFYPDSGTVVKFIKINNQSEGWGVYYIFWVGIHTGPLAIALGCFFFALGVYGLLLGLMLGTRYELKNIRPHLPLLVSAVRKDISIYLH